MMISELYMENCALIDKLTFYPEKGLNIITGETGSGKSIILESIRLCLGGKYDSTFLRKGSEKGIAEITLTELGDKTRELWSEKGYLDEEDDRIIISRTFFADGKSSARVNGRGILISELKKIMSQCADMHGQNQNQSLYDKERHIEFLDNFAGDKIDDFLADYSSSYRELMKLKAELGKLRGNKNERELERELDLLKFQIEEITKAELDEEEYEELLNTRERYRNSEKIFEALSKAYAYLKEEQFNANEIIGSALGSLESVSDFDREIENVKNEVEGVYYTLQDSCQKIRDIRDTLDFNAYELEEIEQRTDLINSLRRKYGDEIKDIYAYLEKIEKRVETIENLDKITQEIKIKIEAAEKEANIKAEILSEERKKQAQRLEKALINELSDLDIKNVRFKVAFEHKKIDESGCDDIEFFITFNLGEDLKPLSKVASGGEMSRFMLAFKSILSKNDGQDILIFDEIDTGISGVAAQAVGTKLLKLGKDRQIICVTHLPQISSMGKTHFGVYKESDGKRTYTRVVELSGEKREKEIARLISGEITKKGLDNAAEMLSQK